MPALVLKCPKCGFRFIAPPTAVPDDAGRLTCATCEADVRRAPRPPATIAVPTASGEPGPPWTKPAE